MAAAVLALHLIRVTGRRVAWVLIASAILLMTVRRAITMAQSLAGSSPTPQLNVELVALVISALMLLGLALIRPVFEALRRSEDVLRKSEARLAQAQQIARLGNWEWDTRRQRVYCSEQGCRVMGLQGPVFDGTFEGFIANVHPDDQAQFKEMAQRCLSEGSGCSTHFRVVRPDGSVGDIHARGWVDKDGAGQHQKLIGTVQDVTERREAEEQVIASERELSAILANMQDTYYRTDAEGYLVRASDSVKQLLGYTSDEVVGTRLADYYVEPAEREAFIETLRANGGWVTNFETRLRRRDGSAVWVSTNARQCLDEQGVVVGVEGTTRDVSARRRAEDEMGKLSRALEQTADSVIITDRNGTIEYVNPAFETITGFTRAEAEGRNPNLIKSDMHYEGFYRRLWGTILAGEVYRDVLINRRKDGTVYYEEKTITPLKDAQDQISHFISSGKDITERMQTQERLYHLAHHDVLTGLPNRALFLSRLNHALARAQRGNADLGVLFMDLDRFKNVNDSLGHDVGDDLLRDISARLLKCVREADTLARWGGDEFTVLLEDVADNETITTVAQKLLSAFWEPFELDGRELFLSASVGISRYPADGGDTSTLLKNADAAMYRAKEHGRNTYEFYSAEMGTAAMRRLSLESDLRRALDREEFFLLYQPQYDIDNNSLIGVEALIRWQRTEQEVVPPADFIPLLEETGLIVPVGEWVLRAACHQAELWRRHYGLALRMAVNLSRRQLGDPEFVPRVERSLSETGWDPRHLEFEITESLLMHDFGGSNATLTRLGERGISLAIDDFGTGYSSLSYLKRLPIHTLKIDRAFIQDIEGDGDDTAIVNAIVAMARSLNLRVVAEGVETPGQLDVLRRQGCHFSQGFLHSRPCVPGQIGQLLQAEALAQAGPAN